MRNVNGRSIRPESGPPLASYPPTLRRMFFWYDALSDWQRVQYAGVTILFLLACGGYLLGLGSAIVLARVEAEQAALAAEPLPTEEPTATALAVIATTAPTRTPPPSSTPLPPTPRASATPFNAPVIAEPPAVPRQLPAAPVVVAPAVAPRATPTASRPRNVETPAVRVLTPTAGLVRNFATPIPTSVRELTRAPTVAARATALPTLAVPTAVVARTVAPTSAPTRAVTAPPAQPTAVRTPGSR